MRKYYVEKFKFRDLIGDLAILPHGEFSRLFYFKKFTYVDFFVSFQIQRNACEVVLQFFVKYPDVRLSNVREVLQIGMFSVTYRDFEKLIFDSTTITIDDFFTYLKSVDEFRQFGLHSIIDKATEFDRDRRSTVANGAAWSKV